MPNAIEMRVEARNNTANGIHRGDQITLPRGITGIVESMSEKQTYIHVKLVGGTTGRFLIGSEVNVTRVVPTFEEQLAGELMNLADEAQHHVAGLRKLLDRQVEALTSNYRTALAKDLMYPFSLDDAASAAKTQAELAVWRDVEANAKFLLDRGEDAVYLSSIMDQRGAAVKALTQNYGNPLSRSTSIINNIHEDLVAKAYREFLYTTDRMNVERLWEMAGPDILEARAQRIAKAGA